MAVENNIGALIGKVFEDGYIDDRDNIVRNIDSVVIFIKDLDFKNVTVCPHFDKTYFLNDFYLNKNDNTVHLSKFSYGIVPNGDVDLYNKNNNINNMESEKRHTDSMLYLVDKKAFAHRYGLPSMVGYAFTW